MKLTPAERQRAISDLPHQHPARTMLRLGLRMTAIAHDKQTLTDKQRHRLDTELRPLIERAQAASANTNMRGTVALLADQADHKFADIMGSDWTPRPDNPVERECLADLRTSLKDL